MFDKQYRFTGTHAQMVNDLTAVFDDSSKSKLFEHNYDVYINAPLIGFIYKRKGRKNNDGGNDESIFVDQLLGHSDVLKYIFRLVLLLDEEYESDESKRLDKAFRYFEKEDENDLKLFDEYVLGGVEILHEKLVKGANKPTDYIDNLYDFLDDFNAIVNNGITSKDVVALCIGNINKQ